MIGKISIQGGIHTSFIDANGVLQKGTDLLNVITQAESQPLATGFLVEVNSPGGYVDVGNDIYDFLLSLKKQGKTVDTKQVGLVGSIATKIFLAGTKRIVDDRYKFWIHNPYQEDFSGDADAFRAQADSLDQTEKEIRKAYAEFNTVGDTGIDALMKRETGLTADECIVLKFGTEKVQSTVLNTIKENMSTKKEDNSLRDGLLALLGIKSDVKKGVAPKAAIPVNEAKKSLKVDIADNGGSFWVEADVMAVGVPAFMYDAEGNVTAEAVEPGTYPSAKYGNVVIEEGKVASFDEEVEEEEVVTEEEVDKKVEAAVAKIKAELKAENEAAILAMKKDVKLGVAPKKAFIAGGEAKVYTVRTIAQVQNERSEKNKAK